MNNIAISPNIFMYALQNQNVECKIVKNLDINVEQNVVTNVEQNVQTNVEQNVQPSIEQSNIDTTLIDDLQISDNLPLNVDP